jgi:hypothetical protein
MRVALAVIVGYLALLLAMFLILTVVWFVLGPDRAHRPGTFELSHAFAASMVVSALLAGLVGGVVARRIAPNSTAPLILAAIFLVVGLAGSAPSWQSPAPVERPTTFTMVDAMNNAPPPLWSALLSPLAGFLGILVGGKSPALASPDEHLPSHRAST